MEVKLAKLEQDLAAVNRRLEVGETLMKTDHDTLVRCEQEHDMFKKSIENIEKLTNGIHDMLAEIKAMRVDLNDIDGRVEEIEKKPVKRLDTILTAAITAIVGVAIGYILKGGI
jgi:predicted  nucleic acid-binding Zn-ribbon protein